MPPVGLTRVCGTHQINAGHPPLLPNSQQPCVLRHVWAPSSGQPSASPPHWSQCWAPHTDPEFILVGAEGGRPLTLISWDAQCLSGHRTTTSCGSEAEELQKQRGCRTTQPPPPLLLLSQVPMEAALFPLLPEARAARGNTCGRFREQPGDI